MSTEQSALERKKGLAILTLANPDANRLNRAVLNGLDKALAELPQPDVRAVLLNEGSMYPCGADVKELFGESPQPDLLRFLAEYMEFIAVLEVLPKPTIAAVHVACSSGGLELALGVDYQWPAAGSKIGFLEAAPGIPSPAEEVHRITARAVSARALEIAAAGQLFDAETFGRWNVVSRVVPADALLREAEAFAARVAEGPTRACGAIKTMLRVYEQDGIAGADRITIKTVAPLLDSSGANAATTTLMTWGPTVPFTCTGTRYRRG